ncbi:alkaline phosphatase D family protein [Salinigranum sp. GCM10025319]|uniref:alkaline phosphatase D family protein n=1 Tax=Salinigranum sp. GCM10025319 TaxID=3252687 RepID=UPI00361730F1
MTTVTIRPAVDAGDLSVVDDLIDTTTEITVARVDEVFPQSVASGGPTPTGVVLWTRIDPEQYDPAKTLRLEVSPDESFEGEVLRLELPRPGVKPTDNYTVRVDLDGRLEPDSVYYYRFAYGGVRSRTGRCRTLPGPESSPDSLRLGLLNCQNYQNGYFGAMAHLAERDVDFVLHLGDYIYEYVADGYPKGDDGPYKDRRLALTDGETLPMSLNDFRRIYETYKADPYLQRLHERHTVIQTWDDHAIANDRYWDFDADAPVFPEHPCGTASEFTRYLTRAGIQAWWEFVPARMTYNPDAGHIHDSFDLYHSIRFGDLATLLLTDERLFRSEPLSLAEKLDSRKRADPSRTMLGTGQREWFLTELRGSDTAWTVWANAVLFKPLTLGLRWLTPWSDSWDGFEAERTQILQGFADARRRGETSVVTLTGDMHTTIATLLRDEADSTPVGVEFMTPSVTAVNFHERVTERVQTKSGSRLAGRIAGTILSAVMRAVVTGLNADYSFLDSTHFGYSIIEFSRDDCTWDVYWVDKTVNAASVDSTHAYSVRVPAGEYAIEDRSDEVRDSSRTESSSGISGAVAATEQRLRPRSGPKP